jgi:Na+-translocating ferredoxin:NAD+ oxidoreductase subunit G
LEKVPIMREIIKMVVVLTILSSLSGGLLAALKSGTQERIDRQVLQFVKGPAIKKILKGATNDPIADRFTITDGKSRRSFFVGKFNGKANVVAFEEFGAGFGGNVGLMVAVNVDTDKIVGISATTHNETPGFGAGIETDKGFTVQFNGMSITAAPKVTKDGGKINALSGATITSRAVCSAVGKAEEMYQRLKPEIQKQLRTFSG